jgi:Zn-dependent protease
VDAPRADRVGGIFVIIKLLAKFAKLGKVGLAALSFGAYAVVFNWQFALVIVSMLFVHESGHIWAMRHYGMKTKGIYFIPFIGGAAVSEGRLHSRKEEVVVALMGPIWGLAYAVGGLALFAITDAPFFAAVASWTALVTLLNLLPITPLDGGHVVRSITYSISSRVGVVVMFIFVAIVFAAMIVLHIWLLALITVLSAIELIFDTRKELRKRKEAALYSECLGSLGSDPCHDEMRAFYEKMLEGLRPELRPMTKKEIAKSAGGFLVVAAICLCIMYGVSTIPGADLALQVLVD